MPRTGGRNHRRAIPGSGLHHVARTLVKRPGSHSSISHPRSAPSAAGILTGDRQSLIQTCLHCDTAWEPSAEGGHACHPAFPAHTEEKPALYLPFWNLRASGQGLSAPDLGRPDPADQPAARHPALDGVNGVFLSCPGFQDQTRAFSEHERPDQPLSTRSHGTRNLAAHPPAPGDPPPERKPFEALPVVLGRLTPARKNLFPKIQGGSFRYAWKRASNICLL
jgi:hypothetical protein